MKIGKKKLNNNSFYIFKNTKKSTRGKSIIIKKEDLFVAYLKLTK